MLAVGEGARSAAAEAVGAHDALLGMDYARASVADVAAEWGRMRSAVRRLGDAMEAGGSGDTAVALAARARRYLSAYEFSRELGLIAATYAGDAARIRAIGLKIAESLGDGGLADELRGIAAG